jgi:hypothetical protein
MITNKGKSVISKYMIGQTSAYASYLAIGCGPAPLKPTDTIDVESLKTKETLDFETLRVPITSRGYVTQVIDGTPVSQLVLTAQLPAESSYGITEVGIYPALSNPVAVGNDSRMLLTFDNNEAWLVRDTIPATPTSTIIVDGQINETTPTTIFANLLDPVITNQTRILHNEAPRNGSTSLVTPGNLSTFSGTTPQAGKYLVITNPGINLSQSSPKDKLKIAFSVMPKTMLSSVSGTAKIVVEFGNQEGIGVGGYARAIYSVNITDPVGGATPSRYFTASIDIKDLVQSGFSWADATYIKVFVYAGADNIVALDGMRVDNVSSESPVYGLVGYTVIKNLLTTSGGTPGAVPIVKDKDKTSLIEFRFQVSVG